MTKTDRDGYAKVLKTYSRAELARAFDLTRAAVAKWKDTIPDAYIMKVSILTGMPPEEIAPQSYRRILTLASKRKPDVKAESR